MTRRLERPQPHPPELDAVAIVQGGEAILGLRGRAKINRGAGSIPQFEMAGDEIGVQVCQEDMFDPEVMLTGEREVLIDVTLRIDDRCDVRALVADQV